jgi:hypothetical protein
MSFHATLASNPSIRRTNIRSNLIKRPPQRIRIALFSAVVPSPGAHPALPTNDHPKITREIIHPPSTQRNMQHAEGRLEIIFAQIYAEYIKLLGMNDEVRDTLQKEK